MNQDIIDLINQKAQITLTTDCGCYQLIFTKNIIFIFALLHDYYENDIITSTSTRFLSLSDALLNFSEDKDKDTISFLLVQIRCNLHFT